MVQRNHHAIAVLFLALLGVPQTAWVEPRVTAVEPVEGVNDNGAAVYEVSGTDFGAKDQAPAVLYDFVTRAHENGQLNPFYDDFFTGENPDFFSQGQQVFDLHKANDQLQRIYDGVATPEEWDGELGTSLDRNPAQFVRDEPGAGTRLHRHAGVDAHYRFRNGSFLGLPMAYGGNHEGTRPDMERRFERPDGKKQLYIAWWMRPAFDPKTHWRIRPIDPDSPGETLDPQALKERFDLGESKRDRGERFRIPSGGPGGRDVEGWLIGVRDGDPSDSSYNDDGWLEIELVDKTNIERGEGETLVGLDSGGKLKLPDSESMARFIVPEKYMRAWDSGGRDFSFAWGVNGVALGNAARGSFRARPEPQGWNLFEFVADMEAGYFQVWLNFEQVAEFEFDPSDVATENSPTMQMIGMNTGDFGFQTFRVSEIYQDSTVQRVILADAPRLDKATHYELQRPLSWSSDGLRFARVTGQLRQHLEGATAYVYVFDEDGQRNQEGHPVTLSDQRPAPPPDLTIE